MSTYQCGLVSVSFRPNSPEEILIAMQKAGLTCIEWGSDVHCPPEKAEEIVEQHLIRGQVMTQYTLGAANK